MKLSQLKPLQKNPFKSRGDKQIEAIGRSIQEFEKMMEIRKIVIDEEFNILGGNKRYFALKALGRAEIPDSWVDQVVGLTDAQKREFIVKDNAHWGSEWDMDILNDWGVDVEDWGVQVDWELDKPEVTEDDYEMPDEIVTDIVVGDLFEIGVHRLLCGDSTDKEQVERLMGGEKADICFTSPPYNIQSSFNSNKKNQGEKYQFFSDDLSQEEYKSFLEKLKNNSLEYSFELFLNIQLAQGNKSALFSFLSDNRNAIKDVFFWVKNSGMPMAFHDGMVNNRVEFIFAFGIDSKRIFNIHNYKKGTLTNVIECNGASNNEYSEIHKATFPLKLPEYFITNFSNKSVVDLFLGSGSTMVAAHQLKRRCYGMELEPKYCQVIIDRMRKLDPGLVIKKNGEVMKFTVN